MILKSYVMVERKIFTVNFLYDQRLKSVNFTPTTDFFADSDKNARIRKCVVTCFILLLKMLIASWKELGHVSILRH